MKCPLLRHDVEFIPTGTKFTPKDCIKEECAWWDNVLEDCSFRVAAKALDRLERTLSDIKEKLPQARQTY